MATKNPRSASSCVTAAFRAQGRSYEQRRVNCGKPNCGKCNPPGGDSRPSHGPYWYLCVRRNHRWRRVYLGKELDTQKYIDNDGNVDFDQICHRRPKGTPGEGMSAVEPGQRDMLDDAPGVVLDPDAPVPAPAPDDTNALPPADAPRATHRPVSVGDRSNPFPLTLPDPSES